MELNCSKEEYSWFPCPVDWFSFFSSTVLYVTLQDRGQRSRHRCSCSHWQNYPSQSRGQKRPKNRRYLFHCRNPKNHNRPIGTIPAE